MVKRKVCVVTGTRAEYGLLRHLMSLIAGCEQLELQLIACGMHLSPEFGLTYQEIEADGFHIDRKVEMLLSSDTPVGIAKATGLGTISIAEALADLQPHMMLVLGDRFEILSAVTAALFARIPVAHLHGGETTEGVIDEGIRHAITKMSYLHFVASEEYRRRVIQLGEDPERVHLVGGLGVDGILRTKLLAKRELEADLEFAFDGDTLLVTFHPVTLEHDTASEQFSQLLLALLALPASKRFLFTKANADTDGRVINQQIDQFVAENPGRAIATPSLGQRRYWSCVALCGAVVGNSSSGLLEAPSLGTPTVNIGDRQRGRLLSESVLNCLPNVEAIRQAIEKVLTPEFQVNVLNSRNPYGSGGAAEKILNSLCSVDLGQESLKKRFYDL